MGAGPSLPGIAGIVLRSGVLPGSGHLAAGHRRSGWAILLVFVLLLLAGVAGVGVTLFSPPTVASLTVRPQWLSWARWTVLGLAAAWALVIVSGAVVARPGQRGRAGFAVAGGTALVLLAALAVPAAVASRDLTAQRTFVQQVFHDVPPVANQPEQASSLPPRLNVLLVGSDAGPDRTGTRTDSVILASLDTRTGRTLLLTLPRNLERFPFAPGSVMARQFPKGFNCGDDCLLNAVYAYAEEHKDLFPGDPQPGLTALRSAVTATLGVPVDYHVVVDLAGFQHLVDALGGITIRVAQRLPIGGLDANSNPVKPSGYIEAGLQHMNGEKALAYARSRSSTSDYDRIARQRCIIGAIQRQADPRNVLANFQAVTTSAADALVTDIPRALLPDLVKLAFKVKNQPTQSLTFTPPALLPDPRHPDVAAIQAAVQAALVAGPPRATPTVGPTPSRPPSPGAVAPGRTGTPAPTGAAAVPDSLEQVCSYS